MPFERMMQAFGSLPTGIFRTNLMPNFADNASGPFAGQQSARQYARSQGMTIGDLRGGMDGQQWRDYRKNRGWLTPQAPAPAMPPANPMIAAPQYLSEGSNPDPYGQALSPVGPMAYHFGNMLARQPSL